MYSLSAGTAATATAAAVVVVVYGLMFVTGAATAARTAVRTVPRGSAAAASAAGPQSGLVALFANSRPPAPASPASFAVSDGNGTFAVCPVDLRCQSDWFCAYTFRIFEATCRFDIFTTNGTGVCIPGPHPGAGEDIPAGIGTGCYYDVTSLYVNSTTFLPADPQEHCGLPDVAYEDVLGDTIGVLATPGQTQGCDVDSRRCIGNDTSPPLLFSIPRCTTQPPVEAPVCPEALWCNTTQQCLEQLSTPGVECYDRHCVLPELKGFEIDIDVQPFGSVCAYDVGRLAAEILPPTGCPMEPPPLESTPAATCIIGSIANYTCQGLTLPACVATSEATVLDCRCQAPPLPAYTQPATYLTTPGVLYCPGAVQGIGVTRCTTDADCVRALQPGAPSLAASSQLVCDTAARRCVASTTWFEQETTPTPSIAGQPCVRDLSDLTVPGVAPGSCIAGLMQTSPQSAPKLECLPPTAPPDPACVCSDDKQCTERDPDVETPVPCSIVGDETECTSALRRCSARGAIDSLYTCACRNAECPSQRVYDAIQCRTDVDCFEHFAALMHFTNYTAASKLYCEPSTQTCQTLTSYGNQANGQLVVTTNSSDEANALLEAAPFGAPCITQLDVQSYNNVSGLCALGTLQFWRIRETETSSVESIRYLCQPDADGGTIYPCACSAPSPPPPQGTSSWWFYIIVFGWWPPLVLLAVLLSTFGGCALCCCRRRRRRRLRRAHFTASDAGAAASGESEPLLSASGGAHRQRRPFWIAPK
jgi:hypothetical protein